MASKLSIRALASNAPETAVKEASKNLDSPPEMGLGEGFFRQTRRSFPGILCVLLDNKTLYGGTMPVQTAFEVVDTGSQQKHYHCEGLIWKEVRELGGDGRP